MGFRGIACFHPCLYQLPDSHMPMRQTSSLTNHSQKASHAQVGFAGCCSCGALQETPSTTHPQPSSSRPCTDTSLGARRQDWQGKWVTSTLSAAGPHKTHTRARAHKQTTYAYGTTKRICLQNPVNNPKQAQYVHMLYMHNPT